MRSLFLALAFALASPAVMAENLTQQLLATSPPSMFGSNTPVTWDELFESPEAHSIEQNSQPAPPESVEIALIQAAQASDDVSKSTITQVLSYIALIVFFLCLQWADGRRFGVLTRSNWAYRRDHAAPRYSRSFRSDHRMRSAPQSN